MHREIECRITGRVQFVMYRDFAQRKARMLGITGFVRNEPDGSVKVIAQAPEKVLIGYIDMLKKGPVFARVEAVEVAWREQGPLYDRFLINY